MNIIEIYIASLLASLGISTINELRMYKDCADNGHRLDSERINKSRFRRENEIPQNMSLLLFAPGANILYTIYNVLNYEANHNKIFNKLKELKATERMTNEEFKTYEEFPIGLTSSLLNIRSKDGLSGTQKIKVSEDDRIYYDLNDNGQIEIKRVMGPLSYESPEKQMEALDEYRQRLIKERETRPKRRIRKKDI